jgi:hypothetical protein
MPSPFTDNPNTVRAGSSILFTPRCETSPSIAHRSSPAGAVSPSSTSISKTYRFRDMRQPVAYPSGDFVSTFHEKVPRCHMWEMPVLVNITFEGTPSAVRQMYYCQSLRRDPPRPSAAYSSPCGLARRRRSSVPPPGLCIVFCKSFPNQHSQRTGRTTPQFAIRTWCVLL